MTAGASLVLVIGRRPYRLPPGTYTNRWPDSAYLARTLDNVIDCAINARDGRLVLKPLPSRYLVDDIERRVFFVPVKLGRRRVHVTDWAIGDLGLSLTYVMDGPSGLGDLGVHNAH